MPANDEKYFKEVSIPGGVNLKSAKIHEALIEADAWINVPVLKNHGGAKMTCAMKNYMGIVWDRRFFHQMICNNASPIFALGKRNRY